jgi:hypothetical protein
MNKHVSIFAFCLSFKAPPEMIIYCLLLCVATVEYTTAANVLTNGGLRLFVCYGDCLLFCVRPGLTFTNSAFCPHSVFMCFVWISEQTAIISLYSINWLVFITETECVYCAVRTESICTHLKPSGYYMYRQV